MSRATSNESRLRKRWRSDPMRFIRDCIGDPRPWSRQVEILESVRDNRETNVHSGNGIGKDWISALVVLWWLFTAEDSIAVTTATKAKQVDVVLWGEIRAAVRRARVTLGGDLKPVSSELRIGEKWYAIGVVARDPNAFAGFHSRRVLVVEDEAAGLLPFIDEAAEGCCAGDDDRILRIGNPICGPDHPFAKACAMSDAEGKRKTIHVESTETPNYIEGRTVIPGLAGRAMVDSIATKFGRDSIVYNARVRGLFPGRASDGLISLEHLALARQRLAAGVVPQGTDVVRLGCDVARYGDDTTRIFAARGCLAWEAVGSPIAKQDGVVIARALAAAARAVTARTVAIDGGGLGAGVLDSISLLKEMRQWPTFCSVIDVQFGAASSDPDQWANTRAELWWRMRDWIRDEAAMDFGDTIEEELLAVRYKVPERSKAVILEPKEDVKERLGRSPDESDGLALAVAGHLVRVAVHEGDKQSAGAVRPAREEDSWIPADPFG